MIWYCSGAGPLLIHLSVTCDIRVFASAVRSSGYHADDESNSWLGEPASDGRAPILSSTIFDNDDTIGGIPIESMSVLLGVWVRLQHKCRRLVSVP